MKQHINITLTEEEYNLITLAAEKAGMRRTEFCRYARLGKDIKAVPPSEIIGILRTLVDIRTALDKMSTGSDSGCFEKLTEKLINVHYSICSLYLTED